uniref:Uncharacterized protein n=1 Tax=Haptolina brevifila TaxID=156173 RepID=A0A7S2DES5_9EUKA|mmetsp:Transcript_37017/g.73948  ORF Transcript_37017/g.73948 Transcript_37017/m.73948 type:complete len:141 (+) Transcript_37017:29-451(+)
MYMCSVAQDLRGGTPYAPLPDGNLLAAMHVKDGAHSPPLYGTTFYLMSGTPPFQLLSISPKLCLSELSVDLAISATCALQFVTGLVVEPEDNLALLSYGQMDRQMHLAALPLDALVAFAKTHVLGDDEELSISDCDQAFA